MTQRKISLSARIHLISAIIVVATVIISRVIFYSVHNYQMRNYLESELEQRGKTYEEIDRIRLLLEDKEGYKEVYGNSK